MAYTVVINYGSGDKTLTAYGTPAENLVLQDSFSKTEVLYNKDRKSVINTARFSITLNTTLANELLTLSASQLITCTITSGANPWFKGYVRPVTDFTITTGANRIDFEVMDALYVLKNKPAATVQWDPTDSMYVCTAAGGADSLVHELVGETSFGGTVYGADILSDIEYFRADAGENGKDVYTLLDELLFGYHRTFYADASGDIRLHDWAPASISAAGTFNDANIVESLSVSRDDADETGVAVNWYRTSLVTDKLVVQGDGGYGSVWLLTGAGTEEYPPSYTTGYLEKYWPYSIEESDGVQAIGVVYKSHRYFVDRWYPYKHKQWYTGDVVPSGIRIGSFTVTAATPDDAEARMLFYGTGNLLSISAFEVYADVAYKTRQATVFYPTAATTKLKKFDATWVYTKAGADALASAMYDMISVGCYKYRFRSMVSAAIGAYYTLANTDLNISTTVRITKKTTTQIAGTELYEYEAEGASEISTLTTEQTVTTVTAPQDTSELSTTTDGIITEKVAVDSTEVTIAGDTSEGNQRLLLAEDGVRLQTYETDTWETKASLLQVPAALATSEVYYAFEDNVTDSGTAGDDGTAYGTPTYVTGQVGKAISLNGTDQYVTMPNVANRLYCGAATEFTVGIWIYPTSLTNSAIIVKSVGDNATAAAFYLRIFNGNIVVTLRGTTGQIGFAAQSGIWTHVSITWDGTTAQLYKNGSYIKDLTIGAGADTTDQAIYIGASNYTGSATFPFPGYIDELRIVPTSTVAGVLDLYQNGAPGSTVLAVDGVVASTSISTPAISSPNADLFACRAWVNFDGTTAANQAATYSRTGTTVTVTLANHGYLAGHVVYCNFTSGGALDGVYTITGVPTADTFTLTTAASGTIAAGSTLELNRRAIRASGNVHDVAYFATGGFIVNFLTPMVDDGYVALIQGVPSGSSAAGLWRLQTTKTIYAIQFYTYTTSANADFVETNFIVMR